MKHIEEMQREPSLKEEITYVEVEKGTIDEEETVDTIISKEDAEQVQEEDQEEETVKKDVILVEQDEETPTTEGEEDQGKEKEISKTETTVEDKEEEEEEQPKTLMALVGGEETEEKENFEGIKTEGLTQDQEEEEESTAEDELIESDGKDDRTQYEAAELLQSKSHVNDINTLQSGEHKEEKVRPSPASNYTEEDYAELKHGHEENYSESKKAEPELKRNIVLLEMLRTSERKMSQKEHINQSETGIIKDFFFH